MLAPFPLSSAVSQAASNLSLRLAWREPRVESCFGEQGMSQAIEADRLMNLGEFGRCSEGRDGSLIGANTSRRPRRTRRSR